MCVSEFSRRCLTSHWASQFDAICPASVHTHTHTQYVVQRGSSNVRLSEPGVTLVSIQCMVGFLAPHTLAFTTHTHTHFEFHQADNSHSHFLHEQKQSVFILTLPAGPGAHKLKMHPCLPASLLKLYLLLSLSPSLSLSRSPSLL